MYCGYQQPGYNLFRKNNGLLGLLVLPVVWWFSKTSVLCLPGHLSAYLSSDIYVLDSIYMYYFPCGQKYAKIKFYISWKRHNKKWTFRFFENFYRLNLFEMILNESSYNFRFLIDNPPHIYSGKFLILIYYPKMFSINQNATFSKL